MTKKKPSNGITPPVTEREARVAYIKMRGRRSAKRLHQKFIKGGCKTPSMRTIAKWRARHDWVRLAKEHDETVASGVAAEIAKDATAQAVTRAVRFDTLATESLRKAIEGLAKIDIAALKAVDIRALAEISERATKMHELLEGHCHINWAGRKARWICYGPGGWEFESLRARQCFQ